LVQKPKGAFCQNVLRQRIKKKAVKENIVGNNEIEVQRLKLVQSKSI